MIPSPENQRWLDGFRERHGRSPRILHVGNIANNAYNNARLLNEVGLDCDVICYDYYHIMGCPEWEEVDLDMSAIDPNQPDWCSVDLGGYRRPRWFAQGPMSQALEYLIARNNSANDASELLWENLLVACRLPPLDVKARHECLSRDVRQDEKSLSTAAFGINPLIRAAVYATKKALLRSPKLLRFSNNLRKAFLSKESDEMLSDYLQQRMGKCKVPVRIAQPGAYIITKTATFPYKVYIAANSRIQKIICSRASNRSTKSETHDEEAEFDRRVRTLIERFSEHFPEREDKLSAMDLARYCNSYQKWKKLMSYYDAVIGYSTDGIFPLLIGKRPYIAFEHGTIRDIPFEITATGRIASIVYAEADVVYLTNADSLPQAGRLHVKNPIYGLHGFNPRRFAALIESARNAAVDVRFRFGAAVKVFLAPARQHWNEGFPSWRKGNDRLIHAVSKIAVTYPKRFHVVFVEWGAEVNLSKKLIEELGITEYFTWVKPMAKADLLTAYRSVDCVVDQFILPCIGSVTLDAIALGVPVMTSLDNEAMTKFYGEPLDLLNCSTVDEIADAMKLVIEGNPLVSELANKSQEWFERNHTATVLSDKLVSAIRVAMNNYERK